MRGASVVSKRTEAPFSFPALAVRDKSMSLKAKIEAVIYAAEEPVTLAQLAGLFGEEALEEKRAAEAAVVAESESDGITAETASSDDGAIPAEGADPLTVEEAAVAADRQQEQPQDEAAPEAVAAAEATPEDEKKAARLRDREIREELRRILNELIADYANNSRGMEIREIAGGYRVGTKPEYHDAVRGFVKSLKPPMKLSLQALETLAVVAYKQPVTAPEVGEIRGVDSAGVIGSLISRKLITTAGRKQVIGRPILYKTTKEFLLRFGLKDLNELPSMEEFEKMAAGELAEPGELPFEEENTSPVTGILTAEDLEQEEVLELAVTEEDVANAEAAVEIAEEADEQEDLPGVVVEIEEVSTEVTVEEAAEREHE
jgi:segregation and condensation protein B